jgi:RES domain-containing protein
MIVYRLASRKYGVDNCEGARLYGGRWNMVGTPAIYASTTRSLAALEVIVHNGAIPMDYRIIKISLPDEIRLKTTDTDFKLPDRWPDPSTQDETAAYCTAWANSGETAILRVPSAAIRSEYNNVLNPRHADFGKITFEVPAIDEIDPRLRK